jgi:DNA polymerase III subunit gamma/tau
MAESSDRREGSNESVRPAAPAYRVLARKYRPATFEDLIGQEAMVRTLSNAFETGRVPQAWILTGVRGVGKTTTARILARALNYQRPDGSGGPTVVMPELGVHCQAIMESRHVDVLEMDAASHNGVDDVRQINEAVRYAPVTARYKVYILDEVHMLSGAAFNALLKTLEEPPPHAKFVFATTEIRKVPVTVLSRCQRFDLRRVEAGVLVQHLASIAAKEDVAVEADALALIARAADGSVRDALSLLDQAMAHAGPACTAGVRAADVRQMLGLADRARVIDLFEAVMRGDVASALKELRDQYDCGADPVVVLADLAEFTHVVTRLKIVPEGPGDPALGEVEHTRGRTLASALPMRVLSRTWQMLVRGIAEVQTAGKPIAAAEMVLVRIAYAADLPTPEEVIRSLGSAERRAVEAPPATASAAEVATPLAVAPRLDAARVEAPRATAASLTRAVAAPVPNAPSPPTAPSVPPIARFEDVIALAAARRDLVMKTALERDVRLVRIEDGTLEIALETGASKTLANDLGCKLLEWTGRRWMVIVSAEPGAPTVRSRMEADRRELLRGVHADPLVQAVLARFPGAEILDVRRRAPEPVDEGELNPDGADDDHDDDGAETTDASAL